MTKNNFSAVIDLGYSNFRFSIFDSNYMNLYSCTKPVSEDEHEKNLSNTINFLIRDAEKKISNHINNIIVMYEDNDFHTIDISFKKNFDQKVNAKKNISSLLLEADQFVKNSYINKKIIHTNITRYNIDGIYQIKVTDKNLQAQSIILDIKFICLPFEKYKRITDVFKNNNIEVSNFFSSSYVKSFFYLNHFKETKSIFFLDVGLKRSSLLYYNSEILSSISVIPIGGDHITKDISKVMKISFDDSEKIKKSFNSSETEFTYKKISEDKNNNLIKDLISKNISTELLKKVILARVEEIIELIFKNFYISNDINQSNSLLVLIGNGSKLLNKNSFYFKNSFNYKEISFYDENDIEICKAGINFKNESEEANFINNNKKVQKVGIFEKFFNLFSK